MVFTQITDIKSGRGWDAFFCEPIGSPVESWDYTCKSSETQGERHRISDRSCYSSAAKLQQQYLLISKWKVSPAELSFSEIKKRPVFYYFPWSKHESTKTQPSSGCTVDCSVLIALIMNNMFLGVPPERRRLAERWGGKPGRNRFEADHLRMSSPLRRVEKTELLGRSGKWASAQKWHCLWSACAEWS